LTPRQAKGDTVTKNKVSEGMERLSNILAYAQDCDVLVLEDLHTWLNCLALKWSRLSRLESAAAAGAAAAIVKKFLLQRKHSPMNFASGQNAEPSCLSEGRSCL
jgi:hypothetical protein